MMEKVSQSRGDDEWKDVLGTFNTIVLGKTRFVKIEWLRLQYCTVLHKTESGGGAKGKEMRSACQCQLVNKTTVINGTAAIIRKWGGTPSIPIDMRTGDLNLIRAAQQERRRGGRAGLWD